MKSVYLATWTDDGHTHVDLIDDASTVIGLEHGRASAVLPSIVGSPGQQLLPSGALLFLMPRSPTALLASLTHDFGEEMASRVYISHGHACAVVFLESVDAAETLLKSLGDSVLGFELWPYSDGVVDDSMSRIEEPHPAEDWVTPPRIDSHNLQFDARSQIDQFNTNLALLSGLASRYAPEIQILVTSLRDDIQGVADELGAIVGKTDDVSIRKGINLESVLIETNSVLTHYCSQMGSGSLPLRSQTFAVGEYSLLGMGLMCRAAWRIYSHLNETFAEHDHIGVIKRVYRTARGFNPYSGSARVDFSAWRDPKLNVQALSDAVIGPHRQHIPYFSSRWGFHEGLHSISLSWQCLYASASKEWNLLTLTHEYLHAHVRGILGHILGRGENEPHLAETILDMFNRRDPGATMLDSMRLAYLEALLGLSGGYKLARATESGKNESESRSSRPVDIGRFVSLNSQYSNLVNEIIVHVLDFRYVYDGRDAEYVNSIWSSWSLVPGVVERTEEYVLRTLCALSVTSPDHLAGEALFDDVAERMRVNLEVIAGRTRTRHAISRAIGLLKNKTSLNRLHVLFFSARYIVELTRDFILDDRLNAALVMDDLTTVLDNRRTYSISVGEFRGEAIASPIGFLLDQFPQYPDQAGGDDTEYGSIWQMLQLV